MIRRFLTLVVVWVLALALLCVVLLYEARRHHYIILMLFFALVFGVLFHKAILGRRAQIRRRVRALRWRSRLRLRPGPGYASLPELVFRWGRLAAMSHGRRARPGLGFRARLFSPATGYAVRLGRAQYARRVYARMEDQVLVLAPPRTGKSGLIADRVLDHPGPVLTTSTRSDLFQITSGDRARYGPIDVFNPQDVGDVPSTFGWNILEACRDLVMARRIAGWLAAAILPGDSGKGNIEWFEKKGDVALACLLWAAAVSGRTIVDAFNWAQLYGHEDALRVLASHPDSSPQMLAVTRRMLADSKSSASVRDTIELSLSWAIIPGLAAAVTPGPGQGFDLARFINQNGTLYMIATGDEDSPVTPIFSAFASYVNYAAGLMGTQSPAGRLDPPLLMALDEVTQICPVALPEMLSDSAGKGVLMTAVAHGTSQLKERWGEHGGQVVWDTCGTKIILGGISDSDTLEQASQMYGSIVLGEVGDMPVPAVPGEFVRALPDWRALVIRTNLQPVVVKIRPAWKRLRYRLGLQAPAYRPRLAAVDLDSTMPLELLHDTATDQPPEEFPFAGSLVSSHLTRSGGD
jgi:hypothetical protein